MAKSSTRKMKPEIRQIVLWAARHDWQLQDEKDGNGHWVLKHPRVGVVRLPDTPGEFRGIANAKAEIRRKSGLPSESGPAARYRHESRRDGFDMDAAVREARLRRAHEEVERRDRYRCLEDLSERLDRARAELAMINPRRDPVRAREAAAKVLEIETELRRTTE
jgi:hypothetical protein